MYVCFLRASFLGSVENSHSGPLVVDDVLQVDCQDAILHGHLPLASARNPNRVPMLLLTMSMCQTSPKMFPFFPLQTNPEKGSVVQPVLCLHYEWLFFSFLAPAFARKEQNQPVLGEWPSHGQRFIWGPEGGAREASPFWEVRASANFKMVELVERTRTYGSCLGRPNP